MSGAGGGIAAWIYTHLGSGSGSQSHSGASKYTEGWSRNPHRNGRNSDPTDPNNPGPGGGGPGPYIGPGAPPYLPPPPPPPPPPWITYGYPPSVIQPLARTGLTASILAGLDAVPNYPGRYQTDPSTGQRVDTGMASAAKAAGAIIGLSLELPALPAIIQQALDGVAGLAQARVTAMTMPTAPSGGGMDDDTALDTGMCAQAISQAASGDGDLLGAALECLPLMPDLGPAATGPGAAEEEAVRTFAHGTSPDSARDIVDNGVNEAAARTNASGGLFDAPGSFHTVEIDPSNPSEALEIAYGYGLLKDARPLVTLTDLPESVFQRMTDEGSR